jgi:two-component system cell cycle sensor histidine kinase/response regulator CckA
VSAVSLPTHLRHAFLDCAAAAIVVTDARGSIVFVNRETERLFGFARDELLGQPIEMLVPPRLRERHASLRGPFSTDPHARALGAAGNLHGVRKDGTEIPLDIGLTSITIANQPFVIATIVDISRLKHAEETLRRTGAELQREEARYRGLIEASIQGILIVTNDMIRLANPAFAELIGVDRPEQLLGRSIWDFVAPEDARTVARNMQARLRGEPAPPRYVLRLIRTDGQIRWVDCGATAIRWEDEPSILATLFDITEQRRIEDALRNSQERFRELVNHVKEAFIVADVPGGKTMYVSPAFEEIFGRKVEEAYANPGLWLDAIHPDDHPQALADRQANERGQSTDGVYRIVRPDGTTRWARYRMFPIVGNEGRPYRLVGLIDDISEQRAQEEQLLQAQKMEAIGQLAGGIAHDFNNLLTAILGYTELVLSDLEPSHPSVRDLKEVHKAGQSATALTKRILAFSRRQVLQPRIVDVNQVLSQIEPLVRRLIGEHIVLMVRRSPELKPVFADPSQLEQVIMNLAVNARDAMPRGGRLLITTENVDLPQGPYVRLTISDTGLGMTDDVRRRIFEPFFTTKSPGKGTGLGLAIVYAIVKQSNGSIDVESTPGSGSTFNIVLPVAKEMRQVDLHKERLGPALGSETVLVVEDQIEVRAVIAAVLRRYGYTVLEAGDWAEAIAASMEHKGAIHLLLTDMVMPGMDGRGLARMLRANRPEMRVLYTSGYSDDPMVREEILDPRMAFLPKPFTSDTLLARVREVLDSEEQPLV